MLQCITQVSEYDVVGRQDKILRLRHFDMYIIFSLNSIGIDLNKHEAVLLLFIFLYSWPRSEATDIAIISILLGLARMSGLKQSAC